MEFPTDIQSIISKYAKPLKQRVVSAGFEEVSDDDIIQQIQVMFEYYIESSNMYERIKKITFRKEQKQYKMYILCFIDEESYLEDELEEEPEDELEPDYNTVLSFDLYEARQWNGIDFEDDGDGIFYTLTRDTDLITELHNDAGYVRTRR